MSKSRKYGLHAERTTLCAVKVQLSQASVTSTKSSFSLRRRNELRMLKWKSFHLSEYCCSPPLDEDEEAAMASVPLGLTIRGAIVFTPHNSTLKLTTTPLPVFQFTLLRWDTCAEMTVPDENQTCYPEY